MPDQLRPKPLASDFLRPFSRLETISK